MIFMSPGAQKTWIICLRALGIIKNFTPSDFIRNGSFTPSHGPGTRWSGTRLQLEVSGSIPHRVSIFVDFLLKK